MGLKFYDAELLIKTLPRVPGARDQQRLLTLGVQDCYFTLSEMLGFLKEKGFAARELQPSEILPTTGMAWEKPERRKDCPHQKTFFSLLGLRGQNVESLDASDYEKPDFVCDLNLPIPENLAERFDIVFDGGTLEHVFSLKDAFFNMARLVKPGGLAIHQAPYDWHDHGFVNFNPTLFRDFYLANGFVEIDLQFTAINMSDPSGRDYRIFPVSEFKSSRWPVEGLLLFGAYQKRETVPLKVPVQGTYRKLWKK